MQRGGSSPALGDIAETQRCDLPYGCSIDLDESEPTFGQVVWNTKIGIAPCPEKRVRVLGGVGGLQFRGKRVCACETGAPYNAQCPPTHTESQFVTPAFSLAKFIYEHNMCPPE